MACSAAKETGEEYLAVFENKSLKGICRVSARVLRVCGLGWLRSLSIRCMVRKEIPDSSASSSCDKPLFFLSELIFWPRVMRERELILGVYFCETKVYAFQT